jgi:hypothetical protein
MRRSAERPLTPERETRRFDRRRLLPLLIGAALLLVALPLPAGDWRWFLLWAGGVAVLSGLVAVCVAAIGSDGSKIGRGARAVFVVGCSVAVVVAAAFLLVATSSENPVPSFAWFFFVVLPTTWGAFVVLIALVVCRLFHVIDRTSAFVGTFAAVSCLAAGVSWEWHLPLNQRVEVQQAEMTRQGEQLLADPRRLAQLLTRGELEDVRRLGDFEVGHVYLDVVDPGGCAASQGLGPVYFEMGSKGSSTTLIYCPQGEAVPSWRFTEVDHIAGPWWVEYISDS